MIKQPTAVDYLIKVLSNYDSKMIELFSKEINQAKEMFEQQIIDSYEVAYMDGYNDNGKDGKQHYTETFNN